MNPMIDPDRDLVGATPEKLARALLRPLRTPHPSAEPEPEEATRENPERPGGHPCTHERPGR